MRKSRVIMKNQPKASDEKGDLNLGSQDDLHIGETMFRKRKIRKPMMFLMETF